MPITINLSNLPPQLVLASGADFDALNARLAKLEAGQPTPTPVPTTPATFFDGAGLTMSTQFSRSWTDAQLTALKAAGVDLMAITDDWWPHDAADKPIIPATPPDPHGRQAYALAKLAISKGIKIYMRLWNPTGSFGPEPAWWPQYCAAWTAAISHDFGASNGGINYSNEPGQGDWHDVFTKCYAAGQAVDPKVTVGYTPQVKSPPGSGAWDWFIDYSAWAPPKEVILDIHSYGEAGANAFMAQGTSATGWTPPPAKSIPWVSTQAQFYFNSWKRFSDLATQRGQAGLILGELGASIELPPTPQDNINCTRDLYAVAKTLGFKAVMLWNNRPKGGYVTEDVNGNLLPWIRDNGIFKLA